MVGDHLALEHWLADAQLGGVVRSPVSAGTGPLGLTARALIDAQLPPGLVRPWVVYASQGQIVGGGDFGALAAGTSPSYLQFTYGFGNTRVQCAVDLPVTGGAWQLPPCAGVEVTAQLQPLVSGAQLEWAITAAPGNLASPQPAWLTSPMKNLAAAVGQANYGRPACAVGYRVFSPTVDFFASNVIAFQNNNGGATLLSIDQQSQRLYNATGTRQFFYGLHPQTTQVTLTNNYAVPIDCCVQWLIQL